MKYHQIDSQLFIKNRAKFTSQMKPNSVAVFNSNDIYPVSADSTLPFAQHRDILYLSGVDQEESILLLFPDAPYDNLKEILFLKETNDHIAICEKCGWTLEGTCSTECLTNPAKRQYDGSGVYPKKTINYDPRKGLQKVKQCTL